MPNATFRFPSSLKHAAVTFISICIMALVLGACSTTADKQDKLERTVRGYEKALRWAKFDMAYSYFKWESGEQPVVPKDLKSIRLTTYRISNRKFDEESMTASQVVTIRYYNQSDLRERELEDHQKWKYFSDEKRWFLISKPPEF